MRRQYCEHFVNTGASISHTYDIIPHTCSHYSYLDERVQHRRCVAGQRHAGEQLPHGPQGRLADLERGRRLAGDHEPEWGVSGGLGKYEGEVCGGSVCGGARA